MFAVYGDDVSSTLRGATLHARLAGAGVRRFQVNLDDDAVATAMRIVTDEPIAAIVSAWGAPGPDVARVLTEAGLRVHGWVVEERRPLDPPEAADGSRADTLANVALLRRPDDLSHDEWLHRWLVDHTQIAIDTQATFGYVQNIVIRAITENAPQVDALVEELFPTEAANDIHAFYGSGGDKGELTRRITRLMDSCARFGADRDLNLVPSSRYLYDLA